LRLPHAIRKFFTLLLELRVAANSFASEQQRSWWSTEEASVLVASRTLLRTEE